MEMKKSSDIHHIYYLFTTVIIFLINAVTLICVTKYNVTSTIRLDNALGINEEGAIVDTRRETSTNQDKNKNVKSVFQPQLDRYPKISMQPDKGDNDSSNLYQKSNRSYNYKFQRRQILKLKSLNSLSIPNMSKQNFVTIMEKRSSTVREICKRTRLSSISISTSKKLFILPKEQVMYCPLFKAASSSWISLLIDLSNADSLVKTKARHLYPDDLISQAKVIGIFSVTSNMTALNESRKIFIQEDFQFQNNNTNAFIVVRHPFERLVSAFRDKLERTHGKNQFYYHNWGKSIVQQFRQKAVDKFGIEFFSSSNNYGALIPVPDNRRSNSKLPSFWEFVQYLLHPKIPLGMDEHWAPIYHCCPICDNHNRPVFNYILKFETLEVEEPLFLKEVLRTPVKMDERHRNANRQNGMSSHEITKRYFSILSDSDIKGLYNLFKPDFLLFEYQYEQDGISLPPK